MTAIRCSMLLLAVWVLIASPWLCLAGSLAHPCAEDCGGYATSSASGSESHGCDPVRVEMDGSDRSCADGCVADFCSHEEDCVGDPCADSVVRPDSGSDHEVRASLAATVVPTLLNSVFRPVTRLSMTDSLPPGRFLPRRIPVPASDLPLRN